MPTPEAAVPTSKVDISTDAFSHDAPHLYAEIRRDGPIVWQEASRGYLVTGYADSAAILRSPDIRAADLSLGWQSISAKLGRTYDGAMRLFSYMPFVMDGKRHLQIRRAMAVAVAPFAGRHPSFQAQIDSRIRRARQDGGFDLVSDFGSHLMFDVFCDLMEIPVDERSQLKPIATMSWVFEATTPERERRAASAKISECIAYLTGHVRTMIEKSDPGFIGNTYRSWPPDEEDKLGAVATMACVMLVMGNNALGTCLAGGVHKLKTQSVHVPQSEWASISDDAIRYMAPVDFLNRFAARDMPVAGCPVKEHTRLIVSPMSANHDPDEFGPDAEFVTARADRNVGLTFGAGAHICVGNRISRTILRLAFAALSKLPEIRLAGDATFGRGKVVRTFSSIPVKLQ